MSGEGFEGWLAALERRHLADLEFAEVRRGLQALSTLYVERRDRPGPGRTLDGAGKRAAFALFYGPLHFLVVRAVVRALGAPEPAPARIVDLGCGNGAAGAAWALEFDDRPAVVGYDRNPWAVQEARWTYRTLGLRGRALRGEVTATRLGGKRDAIVAAFTVNELNEADREVMVGRLLEASRRAVPVLVVEPIARRVTPWWKSWAEAFVSAGGRSDDWRFPEKLPEPLRRLARAAGLDPRVLTARSLWLPPPPRP